MSGTADVAAPAPAPAGWAFLPPLQREVDSSPPAALRTGFVDALPTRIVPSSLGTMGHLVDARAPAGTIAVDDATLGAPIQRATAVDLPLRPTRAVGDAGSGHRSVSAVSVQRAAVSEVPMADAAAEADTAAETHAAPEADVAAATDAAQATDAAESMAARSDSLASSSALASAEPDPALAEERGADAPTPGAPADSGEVVTGSVVDGGLGRGARGDGPALTGSAPRGSEAAGHGTRDLPVQRTVRPGREPAPHEPAAYEPVVRGPAGGEHAAQEHTTVDGQAASDDRTPAAADGSGEHTAPTIAAQSVHRPAPPPTSSPAATPVFPPEARRPGLGAPLAPAAVQRIAESSDVRAAAVESGRGAGAGSDGDEAIGRFAEPEHPHDSDGSFGAESDAEHDAPPFGDAAGEGAPLLRDAVGTQEPILADRDLAPSGPASPSTPATASTAPAREADLTVATGARAADDTDPTPGVPTGAPTVARTTEVAGPAAAGASGAGRGAAAFVQRRTTLDAAGGGALPATPAMTSLTPARRIVPSLGAASPSSHGAGAAGPRVVAARVIAPDAGPPSQVQRDHHDPGDAPGARVDRRSGSAEGIGGARPTHHPDAGGPGHAGPSVSLPATESLGPARATESLGPAHAEASAAWTSTADVTVQRSVAVAGRRAGESVSAPAATRASLAVQRLPGLPSLPSVPGAGDLPDLSTLRRRVPGIPDLPDVPDLAEAAGDARSRAEQAASGAIATAREAVPSASELRERAEQAAGEAGGAATAALGGAAAAAGAALGGGAAGPGEVEQLVRRLYGPLVRRIKAELLLDRERRGIRIDGI